MKRNLDIKIYFGEAKKHKKHKTVIMWLSLKYIRHQILHLHCSCITIYYIMFWYETWKAILMCTLAASIYLFFGVMLSLDWYNTQGHEVIWLQLINAKYSHFVFYSVVALWFWICSQGCLLIEAILHLTQDISNTLLQAIHRLYEHGIIWLPFVHNTW